MYLILGDLRDLLCKRVRGSLESMGYEVRTVANPLTEPLRFEWRLDTRSSASRLLWNDGRCLEDREIAGVVVRKPVVVSATGWDPDDLAYAKGETHAALLAWIWSLNCPVVNRYPAALWHCHEAPLVFWQPRLRQCGLRVLDTLISNAEREERALIPRRVNELVFSPLTTQVRNLMERVDFVDELRGARSRVPLQFTQSSRPLKSACVVGGQVIWNGEAPADAGGLELALARFSSVVGLVFVAVTLATTANGPQIAAVDPYPRLEDFSRPAQSAILTGLIRLLTIGIDA